MPSFSFFLNIYDGNSWKQTSGIMPDIYSFSADSVDDDGSETAYE